MDAFKLNESFYWIGSQDPNLKVFDIIMETKYGTTYNSYLLKSSDGIVLFESVKEKFVDEYISKINEIASIDDVKYVVCNHTEPDHSGSIAALLKINPNIIVVSSMIANMYLKEIINEDFNAMIVKDNEELVLGNKTLKFISAPNLHWPDSMYTYIKEDKILVTCDSFGAHYAHPDLLLSKLKDRTGYDEGFNYYSTMIMGPFKTYVLKGVDKIKDLSIQLIAPGHGPVIDCEIKETIQKYIDFSLPQKKSKHLVVIPYVSAYGYTKLMAETMHKILKEHQIECEMYDLVESDLENVISRMIEADGILYGSPTLLGDALPPIYQVMNNILSSYHGNKLVSAFGSYGWSGEAVPNLIARLKQQKMKVVDEGLRIKFKPSNSQLNQVEEYIENFINQLKSA